MSQDDLGAEPTVRGQAARLSPPIPDRTTLLVIGDGTSNQYPLPSSGEVVIGRSEKADIKVDDPSISRLHARLSIGERFLLEDLGSANGTFVHSMQLKPGDKVEVQPGVAFELGSTVVIVQGRPKRSGRAPSTSGAPGPSQRPRRVLTHDYFELRLEEECTLAEGSGLAFAVVRVHVSGDLKPEAAQDVFRDALRPSDVIATYGPGEYEVLLPDTEGAEARILVERLEVRLSERGAKTRVGIAMYPKDGRAPERLIAKACEGAAGVEAAEGRSSSRVVVQDRVMLRLHRLIERVAAGNISVLLLGETGVGKEVLAEAVHRASPRVDKPFVKLNCAALTESLFESELFGHERGAFTGAMKTKPGLLETANGGTVFLDEVGEIPPSIQAKLLRVIEDRKVLRVGSLAPRDIDVRFVSATNRDLEADIARGAFRQDLYYRLNGITLVVPPLRERTGEIEGLARVFVTEAARALGVRQEPQISKAAQALLDRYRWPGNIRELRNVIERAVLLCTGPTIQPEHLPLEKMGAPVISPRQESPMISSAPAPAPAPSARRSSSGMRSPDTDAGGWSEADLAAPTLLPDRPGLHEAQRDSLHDPAWHAERQRIMDALEKCAGNQSHAAKLLGISRRTLVTRLVTYRIPRPRKPLPGEDDEE